MIERNLLIQILTGSSRNPASTVELGPESLGRPMERNGLDSGAKVGAQERRRIPDALVPMIIDHRLWGLALSRLIAGDIVASEGVQVLLARLDLHARHHAQKQFLVGRQVSERLDTVQVDHVLLKGPVLEALWYERQGERPSTDLDVLIHPGDAVCAVQALQPDCPNCLDSARLLGEGRLQSVDLIVGGLEVDLHADPLKLGVASRRPDVVWERSRSFALPGGGEVRIPDAETSLAVLLLALCKDRFSQLLAFADIVRIVDGGDIDWDFVEWYARAEGVTALVAGALDVVYTTLDMALPFEMSQRRWQARGFEFVIPDRIRLQGPRGRIAHHARQLLLPLLMDRPLREVAGFLWQRAVPDRVLVDLYYPQTGGPYWWRLVAGRSSACRNRKALIQQLETPPPGGAPVTLTARDDPYVRFPPGKGNVLVPRAGRDQALAGLSMYTACRPGPLMAQRSIWHLVRLLGPRLLPGGTVDWQPPAGWSELRDVLHAELGDMTFLAIYAPPQPHRSGLAMLVEGAGGERVFLKAHRGAGRNLAREAEALRLLDAHEPTSFLFPRLLSEGQAGRWHYVVTAPLPLALHRPMRQPRIETIVAEVQEALSLLPRSAEHEAHWLPMHGDLTPWNLRQVGSARRPWLFDWEDASWAPPGADVVRYRVTEAALFGGRPDLSGYAESVEFWRRRLAGDHGSRLRDAMLEVLDASG